MYPEQDRAAFFFLWRVPCLYSSISSLSGWHHIDGSVQERRNSSALAMELRLSSTNPLISAYAGKGCTLASAYIYLHISSAPSWNLPRGCRVFPLTPHDSSASWLVPCPGDGSHLHLVSFTLIKCFPEGSPTFAKLSALQKKRKHQRQADVLMMPTGKCREAVGGTIKFISAAQFCSEPNSRGENFNVRESLGVTRPGNGIFHEHADKLLN